MDTLKRNLLAFGWVREYCRAQHIIFLPNDILELFAQWLFFYDLFDEDRVHSGIELECLENGNQKLSLKRQEPECYEYYAAIGHSMIQKGEKYSWKFRTINWNARVQIGIIDDAILESYKDELVCDITDNKWQGWGLYLLNTTKYHIDVDGGRFYHKYNFNFDTECKIVMTLDLTQNEGVLSIDFESERDEDYNPANRTHGTCLYGNLDVDKKYRMAIAFQRTSDDTMELVLDEEF